MTAETEAWLGIVQDGDEPGDQETEVVTLSGLRAEPGATIETTDGRRITLLEPAGETREAA